MAGISEQTFNAWQHIGEAHLAGKKQYPGMPRRIAGREEYSEFLKAVKKARSAAQFRAVTTIQSAGRDHWVHVQTGQIRTSPPPPVTYVHKTTGELVYSEEDAALLDEPDCWQRQWSGEAWRLERGDWRAQAWFLERSKPKDWARRTRVDATVLDWRKEAEAAGLVPAAVSDEFEQLVQQLAGQMAEAQDSGPDTDA